MFLSLVLFNSVTFLGCFCFFVCFGFINDCSGANGA
jgi:hypothetical protein